MTDPSPGEHRPVVMVAEDEAMVSLVIADYLVELGYDVLGPFASLRECDALLDSGACVDCALLDCNLSDGEIWPVATRLRAVGVPFLFATGGSRSDLRAEFSDAPALAKPFPMDSLGEAIARLLKGGPAT